MDIKDRITQSLNEKRKSIIELQRLLTAIPAIAPESGGQGEFAKAQALEGFLRKAGFSSLTRLDAPDQRAEAAKRPNLIAEIQGESAEKSLWIMSHLDIVPPGEPGLWHSDPFVLVEKDGKIYGRGVEDNQQGLTASVFAALTLMDLGIKPKYTVKLLFVADEEVGSDYGIKYLLKEHPGIFKKGDLFLVPDSGNSEGTMLEVAEKSVLWLQFTTRGKQCHASMPQLGVNAFTAASELVVLLDDLKNAFPERDPLFDPPVSTFVPTKKEANVPNVNTLPGEDVFCLDSRILPSIPVAEVLKEINMRIRQIEEKRGVSISCKTLQRTESVPTSKDCALVNSLKKAIKQAYSVEGFPVGIGGGTVAAYLRNAGYDTVVWAKLDESAHMPNEYCLLDNLLGDALVMALLMMDC